MIAAPRIAASVSVVMVLIGCVLVFVVDGIVGVRVLSLYESGRVLSDPL